MKKILIIIAFFLTGCTNIYDINNLAIINEIAIDYNNNYQVYIKLLNSENNEPEILTETCESLDECFSNLSSKISKKIYLTHLDLLILSDNIQKNNIKEITNFFLKEDTSRNTFPVIVVKKISKDFLSKNSKDINNLLELSLITNGLVESKSLENMLKDILNYEISYIPRLSNTGRILGYKIIYSENKILNKNESIIVNFIFNKIRNISLLINNKTYKIENCETSYKMDKEITIKIKCNTNKNDKKIVEDYLNKELSDYLINNKLYYLNYLKDKYNLKSSKINKKIIINEMNTDRGDHFE